MGQNLGSNKHDRPYKLLWLNECSEVMVTEQVLVYTLKSLSPKIVKVSPTIND